MSNYDPTNPDSTDEPGENFNDLPHPEPIDDPGDEEKGEPIDPNDYPQPEPVNPGMPVPGDGNSVPVPDPNEPTGPNPGPDPYPTSGDETTDEVNK